MAQDLQLLKRMEHTLFVGEPRSETGRTLSQGATADQLRVGRFCTKCGVWKSWAEFVLDFSRIDLQSSWCSTCRESRKPTPAELQAQARIQRHTYVSKRAHRLSQQWADFMGKDRLTCQVCGYNTCRAAIDFHHRDPSEKKLNISQWITGRAFTNQNKRILLTEIDKCDSLCSRCHRELHWYQNHIKEENDEHQN